MSLDDQKRAIGKVVSVAADRFVVEMHAGTDNFTVVGFDDVHYVARLGSFLMIPIHTEYVVAEVVGLRERDPNSPDRGSVDFAKAASAKFLDVVPVGMLPKSRDDKFRFGVSTFPSLYADALYALDVELDRIFETDKAIEAVSLVEGEPPTCSEGNRYRALHIGDSVIFEGYQVKVKIDDFFGGHSAVLGNTGSGKSCTVASVIQSLFSKPDEYRARGATFVVFDVNGEYTQAFEKLGESGISVKTHTIDGTSDAEKFRLPHWFLDMSEWELLLQASERTQRPILRSALGLTALAGKAPEIRRHFVASCVIECFRGSDGDSPVAKIQRVWSLLSKYGDSTLGTEILSRYGCNEKFGNFPERGQSKFLEEVKGHLLDDVKLPSYEGNPFEFDDFEECIDFAILYEEAHGNRQIRDYCSQMVTRLKSLRDRVEYGFLRHSIQQGGSETKSPLSETEFLWDILGLTPREQGISKSHQVVIIDMNGVDDEVVELVSAVIARMIFRLLRRADPRNKFPVHLVLEEAHRYVADRPSIFSIDASRIFERIAKEGRKYGMFLVVASQRPSELSKTVLSQCANFVVHRIQNPDDLFHIRQMTPFISDAVLKRLPSLPKQHALVFGTSVNLPTTFKVRKADPLPKSDDTEICNIWFRPKGFLPGITVEGGVTNIEPQAEEADVAEDEIPF